MRLHGHRHPIWHRPTASATSVINIPASSSFAYDADGNLGWNGCRRRLGKYQYLRGHGGTVQVRHTGGARAAGGRPGDSVWAFDVDAQEWKLCAVEAAFAHRYDGDIVTVKIGGEEIETTGNHPFWVVEREDIQNRPPAKDLPTKDQILIGNGRWVEARSLRQGDVLRAGSGAATTVETLSARQDSLTVYNLQVRGLHNYSVAKAGVLVHNNCTAGGPAPNEIRVIGRLPDTYVAKSWPSHDVLDIPNWTPARNAGILIGKTSAYRQLREEY